MNARDPFSQYYAPLLDESYDVVDRIVLNAYFIIGQGPGGFRLWWRQLYGHDQNLNDTSLMRLAGRFARRVRGWAGKHGIPVVQCTAGERKHQVAEEYFPSDPSFRGIFAVLVGRAPAPVWEVKHYGQRGLEIRRKTPMPWVNHYFFHLMDDEWGHVTIKVCGHPPFSAQVMLNGHEYVACQARKAGLKFKKEGNCFVEVSNATDQAKVADALQSQAAIGRLRRVCERWIYQCVCFGLSFDDQKKTNFQYSYSVFQAEYSRNLLFTRGRVMDQVFAGVIDRTRASLDVRTIKTIFGSKRRRKNKSKKKQRCEVVLERPTYDLTVFKIHFGHLTLKVYTKGERVLRTEAIVHSARELGCGRSLEKFGEIVAALASMVDRFLGVVRCVDIAWIDDGTLEQLPTPSIVGTCRVGGIDINKPRMLAAMEAVVALASAPKGFTAAEHAQKVSARCPALRTAYLPRHAAYDLKKLRGKGFVTKLNNRSKKYTPSPEGLRPMAAIVVLREKILRPLLASAGRLKVPPRPKNRGTIDAHYAAVQAKMESLFEAVGLAA